MKNVACIVCDAPSVSIEGMFRGICGEVFKKNPQIVADCALRRFRTEFGADASAFDRVANIAACKYPLLLSAGSNENMDQMLENIRENCPMPTDIVILPGCNHGNGMYKQTEMYQSAIKAFLIRHVK